MAKKLPKITAKGLPKPKGGVLKQVGKAWKDALLRRKGM